MDDLRTVLEDRQYLLFELDGAFVTDKLSFLRQAAVDLPQPPDLVVQNNWDSLIDSVWWGLASLDHTRFAIIRTNAQNMLSSLGDLLTALACLTDVAQSITTTEHGFPRPSELIIFLAGQGANFPTVDLQV